MSWLRVGSAVYATDQGLGILAKSFYDHGLITDVVMVEHHHRENHWKWYPHGDRATGNMGNNLQIRRMIDKVDVVLFFETPFDWTAIPYAQSKGKRVFLMPMYECMPKELPHQPDWFLCPSLLDLRYYSGKNAVFLPIPVEVPWRQRETATTFIHNAGFGGLKGRNGTGEIIDAWKYVKSDARLILRTQRSLSWGVDDPRITVKTGNIPYEDLWKDGGEGDVFLFPEKFNGLSLPLQEARAAGMLVMATDRFPMNTWLPPEPLIPTAGSRKQSISPRCLEFEEAVVTPKSIAQTVDAWYGKDISQYSQSGQEWARSMSWNVWLPKYREVLKS